MKHPQGRPPKLAPHQVDEIRELYTTTQISMKQLGHQYGVHHMTIYNALKGKGPYGPEVILVEDQDREETVVFERKGESVTFFPDQEEEEEDFGIPQRGPGIDDPTID